MISYRQFFDSRELRKRILDCLRWIPDREMIKIQYFIKTGRVLNLDSPKRYTEKLQWYKLFYRNREMAACADKAEVREYVERKGLGFLLNNVYMICDSVEEIEFSSLPKRFVAKSTLGGGGSEILICKDKDRLEINEIKRQMTKWLRYCYIKHPGREWVYEGKKTRIIIERYLEPNYNESLIDYKFFCFYGRVKFLYVITDRELGQKAALGIYDENFIRLNYGRRDEKSLTCNLEKPASFKQMKQYAEVLSEDFPHVRVDLYYTQGKIIFGELTFFDGSGYMSFEPDSFDYILGESFVLPERNVR